MSPLTAPCIFASHSVCTTVAWITTRWVVKFVYEVGSTVFHKNRCWVFANREPRWTITKADLHLSFTIFHCRMSTIQPALPVCTTSVCWHTCCWHFCSCSSHKTIPFLRELIVTHRLVQGCNVTALSTGITQALMMITWVDWKSFNRNLKNFEESKLNTFPWHPLENQFNKKQTALAFCEKKNRKKQNKELQRPLSNNSK